MRSYLPAVVLYALPSPLLAADEMAQDAPAELVDIVYVVIFGLVFVGMIGGYIGYFLWHNRKSKDKDRDGA